VFAPQPYGLISVVQPVDDNTTHWLNGITWQSRCMNPMGSSTYDECIAVTGSGEAPPEPSTKAENVELIDRGGTPFTVYAKFDCSPVGISDAQKIATDALNRSESWQVERVFWTGLVDGKVIAFPHLAAAAEVDDAQGIMLQSAATIVTGSPVDIATGLGLLEAQLANCYNGVGVIHVPIVALPTLDAWGLVKATTGVLKTLNGNLVSVGAGYAGTSPAGAAASVGTTWLYATGAIMMRRGDVKIAPSRESIDRRNNTVEMIAERTYVLGWDCCHAAVQVDIGVSTT
jgi:hypothetical protein